ncbi:MAG TPA: hypothetical protein VMP01_13980 [Pirellulaceae bacterium]|nr:hypothetical protein [Pirellulaceae bacterium]
MITYLLAVSLFTAAPNALVKNTDLGFQFVWPDRFQEVPKDPGSDIIHTAFRQPGNSETIARLICIVQLSGPYPSRPSYAELRRDWPNATITTTLWKGHVIPLIRVDESVGEVPIVTYYVVVPLKKRAINIRAAGDPAYESEIREGLLQVVSSLDGQSSWGNGQANIILLVAFLAIVLILIGASGVIVLLWILKVRANRD